MERVRFSPTGEHFAVCGGDGRLRIWESETNTLKQEFVPSSHLSAICKCIEWAPVAGQQGTKKKKRRRVVEGEIVVMGTAAGSLVFYSVTKSQVLAHTTEVHAGPVTGLTWSPTTLALFSCGEDGYVVEWDAESTTNVSRWKAGKSGLSCIRVFKDMLLTGGHGITLWNLETKTSVMTYLGHPGLITQMESVPNTDYFVTMCQTERHLRIWSKSERNAVATLSVADNPQTFNVLSSTNSIVSVSVATHDGSLYLFQHKLNGPMKKPLMPKSILTIIDGNNDSQRVPILASFLHDETEASVMVGYGNWLRLRFEQFGFKYLQDTVTIRREFSGKKKKSENKSKDATKTVDIIEVPNDVKHLQPGSESGSKSSDGKGKKRKKDGETEKVDDGELPMEERLSNLTIDTPTTGSIPDGSNLAHLLSQGLHSKDARILQSVLSRWDEDVIVNTVRSLPVQLIVPLLNEMKTMLTGKAMLNHSVVRWLKSIFQVHSAFLMSCSSSEDLLGPFMSLLRTRETLYPQMCQLKGKLELIKGNIEAKEHRAEAPNEALLVYNDESSDEDGGDEDDLIPSESEEFIESDDLGVDDEDSSEEDSGSDSEQVVDSEAATTEDESADETKTSTSHRKKKLQNNTAKQTDMTNGSNEESMDED